MSVCLAADATAIVAASLQIFHYFFNFITIINVVVVVIIQMGRKACTKKVFKLLITLGVFKA
jgi:hypothetical protein